MTGLYYSEMSTQKIIVSTSSKRYLLVFSTMAFDLVLAVQEEKCVNECAFISKYYIYIYIFRYYLYII